MARLAAAALGVVLLVTLLSTSASARTRNFCRTSDGDGWSTRDVRQVIRCGEARWSVPGGLTETFSVAICESGPDLLDHSYDGYAGTFQQSVKYWPERVAAYNAQRRPKAKVTYDVYNPRSNVLVSIWEAHRNGWGGWSCA